MYYSPRERAEAELYHVQHRLTKRQRETFALYVIAYMIVRMQPK